MGNQQQTAAKDNRQPVMATGQQQPAFATFIKSPVSKQSNQKIGMNQGDDSIDDTDQSSIEEMEDDDEPWAIRFAEMLRIEIAQNLLSFQNSDDINSQIKAIGNQVKEQMGLDTSSDMWQLFDMYFDSILYSQKETRIQKIVQNTISGVHNFRSEGDYQKALQIMQIDEDFKCLGQNEYYFILSKVYAQIRHVLYMKFKQLLQVKNKSQKKFRYISSDLSLSDDEDEEERCSLSDQVMEREIQKVDLNRILQDVLKLFGVEVAHVDCDAHLIMRKLEFVYLALSPSESQKQLKMQVEALKEANVQMMERIKASVGKYQEIEVFPLNIKEKYNSFYGMPDEFADILKSTLEKIGLKQSICSTRYTGTSNKSNSSDSVLFDLDSSSFSSWTPMTSLHLSQL